MLPLSVTNGPNGPDDDHAKMPALSGPVGTARKTAGGSVNVTTTICALNAAENSDATLAPIRTSGHRTSSKVPRNMHDFPCGVLTSNAKRQAVGGQPSRALRTHCTSSVIVTCPSAFKSPGHAPDCGQPYKAVETSVNSSVMVTCPSPFRSPWHVCADAANAHPKKAIQIAAAIRSLMIHQMHMDQQ